MGAIRKRKGKGGYEARWYDEDGRQHSKNFTRRLDALAHIRTMEGAKERGQSANPRLGKTPFSAVAEDWFSFKQGHWKPSTRQGYKSILDGYLMPAFGSTPIGKISRARVKSFLLGLEGIGSESAISAGTKRNVMRTLSPILNYAIKEELISSSPLTGLELPLATSREMLFITAAEVRMLADAAGEAWAPLVYWAAYTGMRAGEIAGLRMGRLELPRSRVTVAESLVDVRGKLFPGPPKNKKVRSFRIPRFLVEMMSIYLEGRTVDPEAYVFVSERGRPFRHANWYRNVFKPAVEAVFEEPSPKRSLRFHDLRHTCAAILIDQGVHPKAISDRLGHSSIAITMDRYGHLFPDHDEALVAGLDVVFKEALEAEKDRKSSSS